MTEIDRMARRAQDLLWNPMKRNSLEQLFAVKATVLDGLDRLADDELTADEKSALRNLTEVRVAADLKVATDYTESAIRRRSQLLYLGGMVGGVLVVGLVTWIVANLVRAPGLVAGMDTIPTTLFLGGLGAIVSVMQRLTRGRLRTSLDNGQIVCILLGAFRPAIGAVMAVAILLLTLGGIIPLDVPGDAGQRLYFLGGLAFLAGFSERFAQDMIATARGVGSGAGSAETAEEA